MATPRTRSRPRSIYRARPWARSWRASRTTCASERAGWASPAQSERPMAERKFSDLELERMLAGDLSPARASELTRQSTDADRSRLDELRTEHQAYLASVDIADEVRGIN